MSVLPPKTGTLNETYAAIAKFEGVEGRSFSSRPFCWISEVRVRVSGDILVVPGVMVV